MSTHAQLSGIPTISMNNWTGKSVCFQGHLFLGGLLSIVIFLAFQSPVVSALLQCCQEWLLMMRLHPYLLFLKTKKWLQHPDVPPPQRNWTSHFNTISSFFLVKERRWMPELQPLIFLGPVILVVLFRLVCGCSSHGSCNEGKKMKCIITFEC